MRKNRTYHKKKTVIVFSVCMCMLLGLMGRMVYLMVIRSDYYAKKAEELHERERDIKAARGRIWTEMERYWRITKRFVRFL